MHTSGTSVKCQAIWKSHGEITWIKAPTRVNVDDLMSLACSVFTGFCSTSPFRLQQQKGTDASTSCARISIIKRNSSGHVTALVGIASRDNSYGYPACTIQRTNQRRNTGTTAQATATSNLQLANLAKNKTCQEWDTCTKSATTLARLERPCGALGEVSRCT